MCKYLTRTHLLFCSHVSSRPTSQTLAKPLAKTIFADVTNAVAIAYSKPVKKYPARSQAGGSFSRLTNTPVTTALPTIICTSTEPLRVVRAAVTQPAPLSPFSHEEMSEFEPSAAPIPTPSHSVESPSSPSLQHILPPRQQTPPSSPRSHHRQADYTTTSVQTSPEKEDTTTTTTTAHTQALPAVVAPIMQQQQIMGKMEENLSLLVAKFSLMEGKLRLFEAMVHPATPCYCVYRSPVTHTCRKRRRTSSQLTWRRPPAQLPRSLSKSSFSRTHSRTSCPCQRSQPSLS